MTRKKRRIYRFATSAQWNACLFVEADRQVSASEVAFRPLRAFARAPIHFKSPGAYAPVVLPNGVTLWRDDAGRLHRLVHEEQFEETFQCPKAIGCADRIVPSANLLWAQSGEHALRCFENESLTILATVDLGDVNIRDIAAGAQGSVFALVNHLDQWQAVHVNRSGAIIETVAFASLTQATAFVYLHQLHRFVVLTDDHRQQLRWFPQAGGRAIRTIQVAGLRPCFHADALATDSSTDRIFVGGVSDSSPGAGARIVVLDAEGDLANDIPLDPSNAPIHAIAASSDGLFVAGPLGLSLYQATSTIPDDAAVSGSRVVTPMLQSLPTDGTPPWLRADVRANLPPGSTLEISIAATDDIETRDRILRMTEDITLPVSHRVQRLLSDADLQVVATTFRGQTDVLQEETSPQSLSAPLFDFSQRYIWVCLELSAGPGAQLPSVYELAVSYPGHSLMAHLPSIYRREAAAAPGNFLRAMVGVLEATTQGLDERIDSIGRLIHPSTASGPWLDFIARWLGLPWDDGLSEEQKKRIVSHAEELATWRGTRTGLEILLASLAGSTSAPRFRVTDATADFGFAVVGGCACSGSRLPALLAGHSERHSELGASAALNLMRLPCSGQKEDVASRFAGRIRVEIAATAQERRAWEPWLLSLIYEMVPVTSQVELNWVSPHALQSQQLDATWTVHSSPAAHLGTDAVTGLARLPEVEAYLSQSGPPIGIRLQ